MGHKEDIEQRQEEELLALLSIYPEAIDLRDVRPNKRPSYAQPDLLYSQALAGGNQDPANNLLITNTPKSKNRRKEQQQQINQKAGGWRPIEICMTIKPDTTDEQQPKQLDLYVQCGPEYPVKKPQCVRLCNPVGVSKMAVQNLEKDIENICEECARKGEEVLFMIISRVNEFLLEYNAGQSTTATQSFYDQMLCNRQRQQEEWQKQEEERLHMEKEKEVEMNKILLEAIDEKQKLLENECRRRRSASFENESTKTIAQIKTNLRNWLDKSCRLYPNSLRHMIKSSTDNCDDIKCANTHPMCECKFRPASGVELMVQRYNCLFMHTEPQTHYYAAEVRKDQVIPYWLSEWLVPLRFSDRTLIKEETSKAIKELITIKSTFEHQLPKLNHPSIVLPIAFSYSLESEMITLRLLQQYSHSVRLCDLPSLLLQPSLPMYKVAQHLLQVLNGLNYLHECSIVHGDLSPETVLFDFGNKRIRLAFVFIQRFLNDFERRVQGQQQKMAGTLEQMIGYQLNDFEMDYQRFALLIVWFMTDFEHQFAELVAMKSDDLLQLMIDKLFDPCVISLVKKCLISTSLAQIEPCLVAFFEKYLNRQDNHTPRRPKNHTVKKHQPEEESLLDKGSANQQLINLGLMKRSSRLADYEIISKLGHGGFGEVYKVRNILDQNEYALKKIIINTSNKQLNRKIKQEVRYLSGLNHENVVRYFGAWVEYEAPDEEEEGEGDEEDEEEEEEEEGDEKTIDNGEKSKKLKDEKRKTKAPKKVDKSENIDEDDDDEDEDEDELSEDEQRRVLFSSSFKISKRAHSLDELSDDYVNFCEASKMGVDGDQLDTEKSEDCEKSSSDALLEPSSCVDGAAYSSIARKSKLCRPSAHLPALHQPKLKEVMYIQMELCEKSTLQNAIQHEQLYQDHRRKRRLFRELIEGLAHIHEREIIHRDLKPGNIFLDASDHVKIGDFGLATSDIIRVEPTQSFTPQQPPQPQYGSGQTLDLLKSKNVVANQLHTPQQHFSRHAHDTGTNTAVTVISTTKQQSEIVGTPFYLSPEILAKSSDLGTKKIVYSQKVDIYSVGVIYFEMCYPPPRTGMERFKVLTNLREPSIRFPDDADSYLSEQEKMLIIQLLDHDPTKRPSSAELLQSSYLPPPEFEEEKQQNLIMHVIQNSRSKTHKFLLNALIAREMDLVEDFVYDCQQDIGKSKRAFHNEAVRSRVFQYVSDKLQRLMRRYGAVRYTVPTFVPSHSMNRFRYNHVFYMMDANGSVVAPAYDLRVPFARHIARSTVQPVRTLRRFAIEKVYRSRIMGYHPRELWECAFDIVTSENNTTGGGSILPDVEVLLLLNEIIDQFDCLRGLQFTLKVNSIRFLKAVFASFEIEPSKMDTVIALIAESQERNTSGKGTTELDAIRTPKEHLVYMLSSKNLVEQTKISNLLQILEAEKSSGKELLELIQVHMRRRHQNRQPSATYDLARQALRELTLILDCFQSSCSGLNFKIRFCPGLVLNSANCHTYSKLVFQLELDLFRRRQTCRCILATGGRYDELISKFSVNFGGNQPGNEQQPGSEQQQNKSLMPNDQRVGVGLSLEIEKIIRFVIEDEDSIDFDESSACDLLLYVDVYDDERHAFVHKDLCKLANDLRQSNLRVNLFNDRMFRSSTEISRYCLEHRIKHGFLLSLTTDALLRTAYRVRTQIFEHQRILERHSAVLNRAELADHIRSELAASGNVSISGAGGSGGGGFSIVETSCMVTSATFTPGSWNSSSGGGGGGGGYLSNFGSSGINAGAGNFLTSTTATTTTTAPGASNTHNLKYFATMDISASVAAATNVQLLMAEKTLSSLTKKKVLTMISSSLSTKLNYLVTNSIEVLALEMPFKTLKLIAYECEFERDEFDNMDDRILEENIRRLTERCPKYRSHIPEVVDKIFTFKRKKDPPVIVLTTLIDLHNFQFVIVP